MSALDARSTVAPTDVPAVELEVGVGVGAGEGTGTAGGRRPWLSLLRARVTRASARLGDPSVPVALTVILVMLATPDRWYVKVPAVVLGTVAIVTPPVREDGRFWLVLAATLGAAAWSDRWRIDNHQFLIAYWCLALGLAATSADPARVRRLSARLLVGTVFLLATTWKVLSPDFVDGSFMRYTLLTDSRFSEVATLVGGVPSPDLEANHRAVAALGDPTTPLEPVRLRSTARLDLAARALTWWTLVIEGAVAATFLLPWRRLGRHRDPTLIAFVVTTYAIAPVIGFGWVLVCLGLAQREPDRRLVPLAYVAAFLLVQVFTAPWTSLAGLAA